MPSKVRTLNHTDSISFRLQSGAERNRQFPFLVGPRRLSDTLIEFSKGGSWWVEDLDAGIRFKAGDGRVFVVPAEHSHTLSMVKGQGMRTCWGLVTLEDEIGRDLFSRLPCAVLLSQRDSLRAVEILVKLIGKPSVGLVGRVEFQRLGLELTALILAQSRSPLLTSAGVIDDRVDPVLRFVRDHLHEPLCREDLARQVHLSPTRFHYVFVEATGKPPMKYLLQQRIRRARQLLLSTTLSSREVGIQCGFDSAPHFNRMFAKLTGLSPLQYRLESRQA